LENFRKFSPEFSGNYHKNSSKFPEKFRRDFPNIVQKREVPKTGKMFQTLQTKLLTATVNSQA